MYHNLELLIFSHKIQKSEIAKTLNISYNSLLAKLKGQQPLKLDEAYKIRDTYFADKTIDYLFATDQDKAS